MKIKTSQELDERIEDMTWKIALMGDDYTDEKFADLFKTILRDYTESIVPEKLNFESDPDREEDIDFITAYWHAAGSDNTIDTIQENSNRLLGEEKQ